jgi:hypothetical protein
MTITLTNFGKLEPPLISSVMPVLNDTVHLNIYLWMKLFCSAKGELFLSNIFLRNVNTLAKDLKICDMMGCTYSVRIVKFEVLTVVKIQVFLGCEAM